MITIFWLIIFFFLLLFILPLMFYSFKISTPTKKNHRIIAIATIATITPISALLGYYNLGYHHQLINYYTPEKQAYRLKISELQQVAANWKKEELTLQIKLAENPNNIGLYIKYVTYLSTKNNGQLSQNDRNKLKSLISNSQFKQAALNLLAIDALQSREYKVSHDYWQQLLTIIDDDQITTNNPEIPKVKKAIDKLLARTKLLADSPSVTISVALDKKFATQYVPDQTVFIIAKESGKQDIPVAVSRRAAKELPLEITFDASDAMTPERTFADVDKIIIQARLSQSGDPLIKQGDLIGQSQVIHLTNEKQHRVNIIIDKVYSLD